MVFLQVRIIELGLSPLSPCSSKPKEQVSPCTIAISLVIGFKKFITNKNVVTVIGVVVVLIILYFGYTSSIKKETNILIMCAKPLAGRGKKPLRL